MATNYKETENTATQWRRAFRVQIDNPYLESPKVFFHEEDCIIFNNGKLVKQNAGTLAVDFDPSGSIPLLNPWTGDPLTNVDGVQQYASQIEAYILLHSLYIQKALIRDAQTSSE